MKKIFVISVLISLFSCLNAQVAFSKFTFKKDSPFGCCPGRKMTDTKFKVTDEKDIKYIRVHYYGVNQVGDAVSSDIVGGVNANVKHTKYYILDLTGPFVSGKSYSRWASGTFIYPMKVTAFPYLIKIIYMDGEEQEIQITEENLKTYFPGIKKWINVNLKDGF